MSTDSALKQVEELSEQEYRLLDCMIKERVLPDALSLCIEWRADGKPRLLRTAGSDWAFRELEAYRSRKSAGIWDTRVETVWGAAGANSGMKHPERSDLEGGETDQPRAVPEEFEKWVVENMPHNTVIGDPKWWAVRLWNVARRSMAKTSPESPDLGVFSQQELLMLSNALWKLSVSIVGTKNQPHAIQSAQYLMKAKKLQEKVERMRWAREEAGVW